MNFVESLHHVLTHEGGFVNHKSDPGGVTNLGVTKKAWESYVGHPVSVDDMRRLTPDAVSAFYKQKYWDKVKGDDLPLGVGYCVFDCAVNSGVGRAVKWMQEVAGVEADGMAGAKTVAAVTQMPKDEFINAFCDKRQAFVESLSTFEIFGKGWTRRIQAVREASLA